MTVRPDPPRDERPAGSTTPPVGGRAPGTVGGPNPPDPGGVPSHDRRRDGATAPGASRRERKAVLLRLDPAVHEALAHWAADDLRSLNGHVEWILRRALKDAGRSPKADRRSPTDAGRSPQG